MEESIIALILDPHLQSRRRLPKFVPSHRRERGPCRTLELAAHPRSNERGHVTKTWHWRYSLSQYNLIVRAEDPGALNAYVRFRRSKIVILPREYLGSELVSSPARRHSCVYLV